MALPSSPLLVKSRALIDSLGYVDTEYNSPASQQQVQAQIRAEMSTFSPPQDKYLAYLPSYSPTFGGRARLQTEFKRVAANVPLDAIDMNRYQVKEPTGKHSKNLESWENAVKQLQVAVEHQSNRVTNLELQQGYGTKLAKVRAAVLDGVNAQYERTLKELKAASDKINLARQQDQARNAAKLHKYQSRYYELLSKNAAIKRACVEQERQQKRIKTT
ncbi:pre-mRNA-splicing factor SPF27, putative [Phytophthora infestans T30-4]|uniref:Pre-mRNA-splicing factor SPF27, putative n=1 Tax=Phytophthora infestans (strain T30-4) TaxID=403677 RepID=D0NES2_PHYIT|nr:pre-mRNA-splicing factor SPF27, putative [Phytophthora infestans T30-4]EEY56354.1 pre-mRNA-splicing factor SPF27, putative [Phytophthora infestans T30-4]|eukprot:XP_002902428.1 pre-mRNA-splicing factor SPF27, putative [Phytophthora infestans T30-4]